MSQLSDFEVDGLRLAYRERGTGEPVLLLHTGFVADGMLPLLNAPELDEYRLITYHRRGHGASSRSHRPVTIDRQVGDALALLDRLDVTRAHVVGHSLGANIALQLAVARPEAVGAVVLLEPLLPFALQPETAAYVGATAAEAMPRFANGDHEEALDAWLRGAFGSGYRGALLAAIPDAWQTAVTDAPAAFAGEIPALQQWQFSGDDLASVHAPTLSVLSSATYWQGFRETHDALLDRIPDCDGVVVPVDTHLLQIADPHAVAEPIAAFLRDHPLGP